MFGSVFGVVQLLLLLVVSSIADGNNKVPNYALNRTTMVHLFEWKWNDIADECERFLGPNDYAGVQISPIQENVIVTNRPWWERYQPISYKIDSTRSGTETELRKMIERCNRVGVRIYVDVLLNHMSGDHDDPIGTAGSGANTRDRDYPFVPYGRDNFHEPCDIDDYGNAWKVRNCELAGLHDLDQSQKHVRDKQIGFLNRAIDAGVAGFRVDAAKHMWPSDLEHIYKSTRELNTNHGFASGSRAFFFQEVIDHGNGNEAVRSKDYRHLGAVTEFKHGQELSNAMLGRNLLKWLKNWGENWGMLPSNDALVFVDNHDTQRNGGVLPLTYKNPRPYRMALAFMLAHPYGWPRVMSSYRFDAKDQGPPTVSPVLRPDGGCDGQWVCEHRWRQVRGMVGFRNYVTGTGIQYWWDNDTNQIAFCRGDRGFVAFNGESNASMFRMLNTCLSPGIYCDVVSGEMIGNRCTGKSIEVNENGQANITIFTDDEDAVVAFHGGVKIA